MKLKVIRRTWLDLKNETNNESDLVDYANDYLDAIFGFVDTQDEKIADLESQLAETQQALSEREAVEKEWEAVSYAHQRNAANVHKRYEGIEEKLELAQSNIQKSLELKEAVLKRESEANARVEELEKFAYYIFDTGADEEDITEAGWNVNNYKGCITNLRGDALKDTPDETD